ncbi:hypothetical protein LEP1GSC034_2369 [Leptospira interrogans str. 2003000735]|uniref:Uncharacterized protein n=2 Tax=Leptospira interrogans TaxID=173 RepID=A0A829D556_LEPIR|nr:hypothetical protein LEP1GSC027_3198 [Leptospira interrogans str. 2002000624]EKQ38573.1 hypothetical protein LEP1GSC025_3823 [Leptospira interrogans str. 2002000621]EKQ47468.1 hypothetical protein LEP1GSC026_4591 [Leptospira interrogans str. 2002000623]EMJ68039.1 hypothetical protein LEP1GSC034_2369 [Leptospira interrogans str. 2003000735]EMJ76344.1 hypothetical protein LEP1GSC033_0237 [Leptospira interrogans str. 2002000632]EMJ77406.1 hypothetical protein LEP1GSC032_4532 [Leptospira interr
MNEKDLFSQIDSLDPDLETSLVRYLDTLIHYNQDQMDEKDWRPTKNWKREHLRCFVYSKKI